MIGLTLFAVPYLPEAEQYRSTAVYLGIINNLM